MFISLHLCPFFNLIGKIVNKEINEEKEVKKQAF